MMNDDGWWIAALIIGILIAIFVFLFAATEVESRVEYHEMHPHEGFIIEEEVEVIPPEKLPDEWGGRD